MLSHPTEHCIGIGVFLKQIPPFIRRRTERGLCSQESVLVWDHRDDVCGDCVNMSREWRVNEEVKSQFATSRGTDYFFSQEGGVVNFHMPFEYSIESKLFEMNSELKMLSVTSVNRGKDHNMNSKKEQWLKDFRMKAEKIIQPLYYSRKNKKDKAHEINSEIKAYRDEKLALIKQRAVLEKRNNENLLDEILLITYVSYIVMLEYRNKVWPYEYMAFARRIGELWEPFCRLAFEYPIKKLRIIDPPEFEQVQRNIRKSATEFINSLDVAEEIKTELKRQYSIPWTMVDSGGIKLALDLHFEQDGKHYNCDFKSGFSSNEKGNTNRLLLVASIYNSLGDIEKTILFVRQNEDENNHYLQTLKNSPYWSVYCANDCYEAIKSFTGFNIRLWLDNNVDWKHDISDELREHLVTYDLLKYLTW